MVLVIALLGTSCVFAGSNENYKVLNEEESIKQFSRALDAVFKGYGEVYDANGEDITEAYLVKYGDLYSKGSTETIKEMSAEEGVSAINAHILYGPVIPYIDNSYEEISYALITQDHFPNQGKTWYFGITATGQYSYYPF